MDGVASLLNFFVRIQSHWSVSHAASFTRTVSVTSSQSASAPDVRQLTRHATCAMQAKASVSPISTTSMKLVVGAGDRTGEGAAVVGVCVVGTGLGSAVGFGDGTREGLGVGSFVSVGAGLIDG